LTACLFSARAVAQPRPNKRARAWPVPWPMPWPVPVAGGRCRGRWPVPWPCGRCAWLDRLLQRFGVERRGLVASEHVQQVRDVRRAHLESPTAVAGVSPVPVQMRQGCAQSRCRCGQGAPGPGADVGRVRPVPVQMWAGCAQSRCRCGRGAPSPGADVGRVAVRPAAAHRLIERNADVLVVELAQIDAARHRRAHHIGRAARAAVHLDRVEVGGGRGRVPANQNGRVWSLAQRRRGRCDMPLFCVACSMQPCHMHGTGRSCRRTLHYVSVPREDGRGRVPLPLRRAGPGVLTQAWQGRLPASS
jgi:hypothetical protein